MSAERHSSTPPARAASTRRAWATPANAGAIPRALRACGRDAPDRVAEAHPAAGPEATHGRTAKSPPANRERALSQRKPPRDTGPDRKTRALVLARDGHACVCCGRSIIGQVYSLQHRKRRSQGGGNSPSNLVTVLGDGTTGCHARIDSRIDPQDAAKGYTSAQFWEDPARVPVMFFDESGGGFTAWLADDGSLSFDGPGVAA